MKKYLLGLVAVVIAVGLSAFTNNNSPASSTDDQTLYYWFETVSGAGDQSQFLDNDVVYRSGPSMTPPAICDPDGLNLCIVGFSSGQVTFNGTYHISSSIPQSPSAPVSKYRDEE